MFTNHHRILAWEDGFCNFAASTLAFKYEPGDVAQLGGLQPEIFFKMSHEIYNFGEGYVIQCNLS